MRASISKAIVAVLVALSTVSVLHADTVIDTNPANDVLASWGPTSTFQYGQVITVPTTDTLLRSFSFTFNSNNVFTFNADVAAWSGTAATGPLLFSTPLTTTDVGSNHTYVIDTGDLALAPGAKYVLFFDAYGGGTGASTMAVRNNDPYGGGAFVYANNIPANLTSGPWSLVAGNYDAAFTADFVPTPSPIWGGVVLLGALGGWTVLQRKRIGHPVP